MHFFEKRVNVEKYYDLIECGCVVLESNFQLILEQYSLLCFWKRLNDG